MSIFVCFRLKRENTLQGIVQSVSLRKAVYDEFDGKGVASSSLLQLKYTTLSWQKKGKGLKKM